MNNLFERKSGKGSFKAPTFDPYGKYKNSEAGAFGFRKDQHVIIPGVTSREAFRLEKVRDHVAKVTNEDCTVPQSLINDVYSMYVNDDVKRRPAEANNAIKHKVLDKVYNSLTKIVTTDSPLFTEMLTREVSLYLQKISRELQDEQEKNGNGPGDGESPFDQPMPGMGDADGEGNGEEEEEKSEGESDGLQADKLSTGKDRKSYEDMIDKILDSKQNEKKLEDAMKNAENKMQELTDKLGEEALKDLAFSEPDFLEKIDSLKDALGRVTINKESVQKVMMKILNESQNYFSQKYKTVEESLFDSDDFDDVFGLEFLHPIFRNAELFSAGNATRVYKGKIDLYLDCSGSMGSTRTFEGTNLRMIDLVKGIAMVLYRLGMIENLYFFDTSLYKIDKINEISILSFSKSGGTDFDLVVSSIQKSGNNSVVITDGYDSVHNYTKQAFWIGVGGTTFDSSCEFKTYRATKQCVSYNGDTSKLEYCSQK
tara:strand:- start:45180 stop:46628 length:1449 start_codon:yes stop_codon:yes gene_type:complete